MNQKSSLREVPHLVSRVLTANTSIKRSLASGIAIKDRNTKRPNPNRRNLRDFITYGLKFVFPAKPGAMQRGVPTAFAAPVLKESLHSAGSLIHVWPYARGREMGPSSYPFPQSFAAREHPRDRWIQPPRANPRVLADDPADLDLQCKCITWVGIMTQGAGNGQDG